MSSSSLEFYSGPVLNIQKEEAAFVKDNVLKVILVRDLPVDEVQEQSHENMLIHSLNVNKLIGLLPHYNASTGIPDVVLFANTLPTLPELIDPIKKFCRQHKIPFFYYEANVDKVTSKFILEFGFDDCYTGNLNAMLARKVEITKLIIEHRAKKGEAPQRPTLLDNPSQYKMWSSKRAFDICFSLVALILVSPVMLIIAIILKLESRGPVFYVSKRAGRDYKIFDFYKFRSMRVGADAELQSLAGMNQYGNSSFFKIKNDPRISPFGRFLRKTSLDELPQLFNVLIGDMSLVGNRPLPLYEAEKLTKDQIAWRFLAPAGITGLWQVTKRGKAEMSEEERIQLDMQYAIENSFWFDARILLSTIPALLQKEVS